MTKVMINAIKIGSHRLNKRDMYNTVYIVYIFQAKILSDQPRECLGLLIEMFKQKVLWRINMQEAKPIDTIVVEKRIVLIPQSRSLVSTLLCTRFDLAFITELVKLIPYISYFPWSPSDLT